MSAFESLLGPAVGANPEFFAAATIQKHPVKVAMVPIIAIGVLIVFICICIIAFTSAPHTKSWLFLIFGLLIAGGGVFGAVKGK